MKKIFSSLVMFSMVVSSTGVLPFVANAQEADTATDTTVAVDACLNLPDVQPTLPDGYHQDTEGGDCILNEAITTEVQNDLDTQIAPPQENYNAKLTAQKIICPTEDLLPNWGAGGPDITFSTASDFIAAHPTCHIEPWNFAWSHDGVPNPGDQTLGTGGPGWTGFGGFTGLVGGQRIWVREQFQNGYIPFTGLNTDQNVSAELYCGSDVLHYDNWEFIDVEVAHPYYCVAFNVPTPTPPQDVCPNIPGIQTSENDCPNPPDVEVGSCGVVTTTGMPTGEETNPATYDYVFNSDPLSGNLVDHKWVQVESPNRVTWDMGTPTSSVYLVPSIDHGPVPAEAHESTLYGSDDQTTWVAGTESTIYPAGPTNWISDDDTALWNFNQPYRYVSALVGGTMQNDGDGEIDAICKPVTPPVDECNVNASSAIVSDTTNTDENGNAVALSFIHSAWTASIPGATWIWATNPVESPTDDADLTKTFTKTFTIVGTPTSGTLQIAADNTYSVKVNGNPAGAELSDINNFQLGTQDSYNVSSLLVSGLNTIEIKVTNKEIGFSADPASNPAGLLYKLSINNNECVTPPPVDVCTNIGGVQSTLPQGYHFGSAGICLPNEVPPVCDANVNLLSNASFETPTVANPSLWDIFPSGTSTLAWLVNWINPTGAPATANAELQKNTLLGVTASNGTQWTELDSDFDGPSGSLSGEAGAVALTQTIPTIPGKTYKVSFDFMPRPDVAGSESKIEALHDTTIGSTIDASAGTGWTTHSYTFVADDASADITFRDALGNPNNSVGTLLDNTSVMCQPGNNENPQDVTVTIVKYVDNAGVNAATAGNTSNSSFSLTSTWDADNIGAGSGNFSLGPVTYSATTSAMTSGADYSVVENNVATTCSAQNQGQYYLEGYKIGDTEALALASATVPAVSLTNITSNKFILVINKLCGQVLGDQTLKVHMYKYLGDANSSSQVLDTATDPAFPMVSSWNAANIGAGSGSYDLGSNFGGAALRYAADTAPMSTGANYTTSEVTDGSVVVPADSNSCPEGKYKLVGYKSSTVDLATAQAQSPTLTAPSFTGLTADAYVIVVNTPCPTNNGGGNSDTGSIKITKYECPVGTTVVRSANGVGGTVPNGCELEAGATFGYVHGAQTDANAPYPELSSPVTAGGVTDGSGILNISSLPANGRYLVVETNGSNQQLPAGDILGLYCTGDGDTSTNNDNQELTFVTANQVTECVAYNKAVAGTARINVVKDSVNGDGTFHFTGLGGGAGFDLITTPENHSVSTFFDVFADINTPYTITEGDVEGWDFTSVSCVYENQATGNIVGPHSEQVSVDAGDEITCTFVNTKQADNDGGDGDNPQFYDLLITTSGDGEGVVNGDGIHCDSNAEEGQEPVNDCQELHLAAGTPVNLTALADEGSNFNSSWSTILGNPGTCTGNTSSCTVIMNGNVILNAHFALNSSGGGSGGTNNTSNSRKGSSSGNGGGNNNTAAGVPQVLGAQTTAPVPQVLGAAVGLPRTGAENVPMNLIVLALSGLTAIFSSILLYRRSKI